MYMCPCTRSHHEVSFDKRPGYGRLVFFVLLRSSRASVALLIKGFPSVVRHLTTAVLPDPRFSALGPQRFILAVGTPLSTISLHPGQSFSNSSATPVSRERMLQFHNGSLNSSPRSLVTPAFFVNADSWSFRVQSTVNLILNTIVALIPNAIVARVPFAWTSGKGKVSHFIETNPSPHPLRASLSSFKYCRIPGHNGQNARHPFLYHRGYQGIPRFRTDSLP